MSSSLFVLIHLPGWYALGKFSSSLVLAFGSILGWAIKTDSLWPAYILHTLSNLLVVALLGDS